MNFLDKINFLRKYREKFLNGVLKLEKNNNKIVLLGPDGNSLVKSLETLSEESISLRVFNENKENAEFQKSLFEFIVQKRKPKGKPGNITIQSSDEDFIAHCIAYGANEVIDLALEEENETASAKFFQYIGLPVANEPTLQDQEKLEQQLEKIKPQLIGILPMGIALNVINIQSEISDLLSMKTDKALTTYQAYRIQEKFDNIAETLSPEQQAAGYYNLSLVHRILAGEKNNENYISENNNNAEKTCLQKVLDYSADYKRINYCVNRLGYDSKNSGRIKAAYRRALTSTDSPFASYNINLALAECYLNEYKNEVGYRADPQNTEKLLRAELYYIDALKCAPEADRLSVMKNIARLQKKQGNIQEWTETYTEIALSYLQNEERSFALIEVAKVNPKLAQPYLERAIYETRRAKLISDEKKALIYSKIDAALRPIYLKANNQKGLETLENLKPSEPEYVENPLIYYKIRRKKGLAND